MEIYNYFLSCVLLVSFVAAFCVNFARKTGVIERMSVFGDSWLSKVFRWYGDRSLINELTNCDFCLSFWACVICSVIVSIGTLNPVFILTPIFATPICRILI